MATPSTILVTGASGHLGKLIVSELLSASGEGGEGYSVIAGTRNCSNCSDLAKCGAELRELDLDRYELTLSALQGVDVLVLVSTNEFQKRVVQHRTAIKAAEVAGVKHVVYTSYVNPKPLEGLFNDHFMTEADLVVSRLGWTILRNNCYAETLLLTLPSFIEQGYLPSASGQGRRSYICRLDCASLAAAVAKDASRFDHRVLDVAGDESYSIHDIASLSSEIVERSIHVQPMSFPEYQKALSSVHAPDWWIDVAPDLERATSTDALAITNGGTFKEIVGRQPISLHTFLQMNHSLLLQGHTQSKQIH